MKPKNFIECVVPGTDGRFHYHVPHELSKQSLSPGMRLLVPFGMTRKVAFFIRAIDHPDIPKTKSILTILDETSLIHPHLFKLLLWISNYYETPLGRMIKTALPQGIHDVPLRRFFLTDTGKKYPNIKSLLQRKIIALFMDISSETLTERQIKKELGKTGLSRALSELNKKGLIRSVWEVTPPPVRRKTERIIFFNDPPDVIHSKIKMIENRAPVQAAVMNQLFSEGGVLPASSFTVLQRAAFKRMIDKGLIFQKEEIVSRLIKRKETFPSKGKIFLNSEQQAATKAICTALKNRKFSPFLLHGVTGSGKTEVYLKVIETAFQEKKGAILLVPEISLTTQLVARFHERFGNAIALLHSGLSPGERYDEWRRIQSREVLLAIGVRSAIFAPFSSLGVIICDEEHDASYKQEEGSHYHARDIALVRGREANAVVVLGSATPSFESYYNSQNGKYHYLHLPKRIDNRPLPAITLANLKDRNTLIRPFFTEKLITGIKQRLLKKEQILLFVNRRGFSPSLICRDCGQLPSCVRCSVSLTFHKQLKKLICHYCGFQCTPPTQCSECHGRELIYLGIGTEQVEEIICSFFPEAKVARLDRDTTRKKDAFHDILTAMKREEIDILIGTQMIAKGHDFPKVTLVGILCADMSLYVPDFRSAERTFQLLVQVAGRAGRGALPGEVIIQTYQCEAPSIQAATTHDYLTFYAGEINARMERNYPPFCRLTLLLVQHNQEEKAANGAKRFARLIQRSLPQNGVTLLGPAPASCIRLRGKYRYQILLKGTEQKLIANPLRAALKHWKNLGKGLTLEINVNPQKFG
ncbi:MAG: primosomal protein N' [Nitrospiria bacterium]